MKSIRARLTLWYTSLFSLSFILLASAAHWMLGYSLSNDVNAALTGVSNVLVEQAHKSVHPFFPRDVDEIFRRFFGYFPRKHYFEMLDPKGNPDTEIFQDQGEKLPLSPKTRQNAKKGLPTFETIQGLSEYPVRLLTVPVVKAGRVVNMVQVGMSLEEVYKTRRRFLFIALGLLPICIVLAGGGGSLLARRALKPVDHMVSAAERISAEAISERLETNGSDDELDRLAKTLNNMLGRLADAFGQIRRFSANASHELQTPLTILKGELEVSLRSERTATEYREVLESALEEINRFVHLVEGLLLLSRADSGVLRMDLKPVDLAQLAQEVLEQTRILAETQNINLKLKVVNPAIVNGDYEQLRRLIVNLVDNAVKYTDSNGTVSLIVHNTQEWATFQVRDNGIGILPEDKEQIFQPFYRAGQGAIKEERGSGLGLPLVKSIAEAHGGKIEVKSTPGQGSVFKVSLPNAPLP